MSSECWNEVVIRTQVIGQIHRVYPHRRGSKLKYRFQMTPNGRRRTRRKTMRTIIHPLFPTVLRPRHRRVSNPLRGSGRHRRMSRRCPSMPNPSLDTGRRQHRTSQCATNVRRSRRSLCRTTSRIHRGDAPNPSRRSGEVALLRSCCQQAFFVFGKGIGIGGCHHDVRCRAAGRGGGHPLGPVGWDQRRRPR